MRRCVVWIVLVFGVLTTSGSAMAQIRIIPQERVQEAANPSTIGEEAMLFEEGERVSFGTISEDSEPWRTTLRWHTTEGKRLTIKQIKTTCGCLTAEWDRRKAVNATSGTIEIEYRPKGHTGGIRQRIFVYTTLSENKPTAIVECVGTVKPSADRSSLYPHQMGTLGLRSRTLTLPAEGGVMEIAVMNCGSEPLRVMHDERMSLGGVKAHTEPAVLPSGAEGVLVVEFEPTEEPTMLYLGGVTAPPRERKIEIEIEK